jgi:dienelactone hydrolase
MLWSAERGGIEKLSENKFRAAVVFHPPCGGFKPATTIATLILMGGSDDWTPADACRKLASGEGDLGEFDKAAIDQSREARHRFLEANMARWDEAPVFQAPIVAGQVVPRRQRRY